MLHPTALYENSKPQVVDTVVVIVVYSIVREKVKSTVLYVCVYDRSQDQ